MRWWVGGNRCRLFNTEARFAKGTAAIPGDVAHTRSVDLCQLVADCYLFRTGLDGAESCVKYCLPE